MLLLNFIAIQGLAPPYMSELVRIQQSQQSARSATVRRLVQPRSATKTYGDRAFSIIGPRTWNTLPASLRDINDLTSFKKSLKTFLFAEAYSYYRWLCMCLNIVASVTITAPSNHNEILTHYKCVLSILSSYCNLPAMDRVFGQAIIYFLYRNEFLV